MKIIIKTYLWYFEERFVVNGLGLVPVGSIPTNNLKRRTVPKEGTG